jgi:hypothetical protein
LAYLPLPPTGLSAQTVPNGNTVTLQPGIYNGGLSFSGQTSVTMQPGIYWMKNGGFSLNGQASLNAPGVMIYSDQAIDLEGQGNITISPPTTGIYQGISLVESRSFTGTAKIAGNGSLSITGTIYVPDGTLQITGNGTTNNYGSQVITFKLTVSGNGTVNVTDTNPNNAGRMRILGLVE